MKRLASERGGALYLALAFAAVIALVAASLARITHSRALLFSDARSSQYASQASTSTLNETRSCLVAAGLPPPAAAIAGGTCGPWSPSSGAAVKTVSVGVNNRTYRVVLTYREDAGQPGFEVQATEL